MRLLPRHKKFFELFQAQADAIFEAAILLAGAMRDHLSQPGLLETTATRLAGQESECDRMLNAIVMELDHSFYTPIDPEDILELAGDLDDIIDGLEDVSHRLVAYKINPIPAPMIELSQVILGAVERLQSAIKLLQAKKPLLRLCQEVMVLERKADALERQAVAALFSSGTDAVTTIKLREVYEFLERTADACGHVAVTLQHVHLKTS